MNNLNTNAVKELLVASGDIATEFSGWQERLQNQLTEVESEEALEHLLARSKDWFAVMYLANELVSLVRDKKDPLKRIKNVKHLRTAFTMYESTLLQGIPANEATEFVNILRDAWLPGHPQNSNN